MARFFKQALGIGPKKPPPTPPHPDYTHDDSETTRVPNYWATPGHDTGANPSVSEGECSDRPPPGLAIATPKHARYKHSSHGYDLKADSPAPPVRSRSASGVELFCVNSGGHAGDCNIFPNTGDSESNGVIPFSKNFSGVDLSAEQDEMELDAYSDPIDVCYHGDSIEDGAPSCDIEGEMEDNYSEPYDIIKLCQSMDGVAVPALYDHVYDPVSPLRSEELSSVDNRENRINSIYSGSDEILNMDNPEEPIEWTDVRGKLMQIELGKVMKGKGQGLKKPTNHSANVSGSVTGATVSASPAVAPKKSTNLSLTAKPRVSKRVSVPVLPVANKKDPEFVSPAETRKSQEELNESSRVCQIPPSQVDDGQGTYEDPWDLHSKQLELENKFRFANQQKQVSKEVQMKPKLSISSSKEVKDKPAVTQQKPVPRSRSVPQQPPPDVVADGHKLKSTKRSSPETSEKPKISTSSVKSVRQPTSPDTGLKSDNFRGSGSQTPPDLDDLGSRSGGSARPRLSHQHSQPAPPDMVSDLNKPHTRDSSSPDIGQRRKPRLHHHHSSQEILDRHSPSSSPKTNVAMTTTNQETDNRPEDEYEDPWDKRAAELHREIARRHQTNPLPQEIEAKPPDEYEEPWDTRARSKVLSQLYSQDSLLSVGSSSDGSAHSSPTSSQHQSPKKKLSLDITSAPRSASLLAERSASVSSERSANMLGERVDPAVPLEKQGWYHGAIKRNDAEHLLRVHKEGSYLVRKSESSRKDFSLSLKSCQGFMHMKIVEVDGRFILGQFSQPFNNIPAMIHHYSLSKLPIKGAEHMSLQHPVMNELL